MSRVCEWQGLQRARENDAITFVTQQMAARHGLLFNGSKTLHCDEKFINSCGEYTKWRKMFCNTAEVNTKN